MADTTARHALPLLAAAQAHKEITHNEALIRLSGLVHPVVAGPPQDAPPPSPGPGQAWLVGSAPTGAWTQQAARIALWDDGGWRFLVPVEGMLAWSLAELVHYRFEGAGWSTAAWTAKALEIGGKTVVSARRPAIADPAGGTTVDAQARTTVTAILGALRAHGLIETV
jgi:hypothetical protein